MKKKSAFYVITLKKKLSSVIRNMERFSYDYAKPEDIKKNMKTIQNVTIVFPLT